MENIYALTLISLLLLLCICSSKLSSWIKMPVLIVFLGVGMLINLPKDSLDAENVSHANLIGSIAMVYILFYGGFETKWASIKKVAFRGILLSTLGVLLSAFFVGVFSYFFLKWQYPQDCKPISVCLLLGAIVSSTDAAAVFSVLRSKSVSLSGQLSPLLELESGSNDPMAALMTIMLVPIAIAETKTGHLPTFSVLISDLTKTFFIKMSLGIAVGFIWGKIAVWLFNRSDFEYDGLYYVLGVATALFAYSGTEALQGNGFMAVYVCGLVMGNSKFIYHNGLGRFLGGVSWLMQVILFCMLGMICNPSQVWYVREAAVVALFLMFFARPLAVFLCMIGRKFNYRERTLISWVGLRGGAPIMLATFAMIHKVSHSSLLFHVIFFIVLMSVLVQGMTIMPLAKMLKLAGPLRRTLRMPLTFEETGDANSDFRELPVPKDRIGQALKDLHLPNGVLVLLIRRDDRFVVPRGNTMLEANDVLTLMGTPEAIRESEEQLNLEI